LVAEIERLKGVLALRNRSIVKSKKDLAEARRRIADLEGKLAQTCEGQIAKPGHVQGMPSMAAALAHELNQPLSSIAMLSKTCARNLRMTDGVDVDLIEAIEQVATEAERAVEMVRGLRQLRVGASPKRTTFDIGDLIHATVGQLRDFIRAGQTRISIDIEPGLTKLRADRTQIGQILTNLIRNAVEAMAETPKEQRFLEIKARQTGADIEVAVRDQGGGLSPDIMEHLFEAYQTTKPQGMGLGLALCRSILQAHAGRLWVKPNNGPGTTFLFALPITS